VISADDCFSDLRSAAVVVNWEERSVWGKEVVHEVVREVRGGEKGGEKEKGRERERERKRVEEE
jgi:hypothetical protein